MVEVIYRQSDWLVYDQWENKSYVMPQEKKVFVDYYSCMGDVKSIEKLLSNVWGYTAENPVFIDYPQDIISANDEGEEMRIEDNILIVKKKTGEEKRWRLYSPIEEYVEAKKENIEAWIDEVKMLAKMAKEAPEKLIKLILGTLD
mgnify:CR=1 FL=1